MPAKKSATKAPAKKSAPKAEPRISKFSEVPSVATSRTYTQTYPFADLKPGQRILLTVDSEKKAKAVRANLYGAFYRFVGNNPEAKSWERTIRIGRDDESKPINVGFYRTA